MKSIQNQSNSEQEKRSYLGKKLPGIVIPIVSTGLFLIAVWILYHEVKSFHIYEIARYFHEISLGRLSLAVMASIVSYLALTGYDNLALKHIRHTLGYGRTAFASYIGYAFSNTIGFSYISGGFIRYRFYSAWGLSAAEIARVVVFTIFSSFTGNWVDGDRTRPPRHDHQRCIRCFCCQETCPAGAIYVKKPPLRRIFFNY
jgi:uncharacterized membrane protein YbhN (UPF0104 family)